MSSLNNIFSICKRGAGVVILSFMIVCQAGISLQAQSCIVEKASFSKSVNDEFAPVFYNKGIVFCSNQRNSSPVGFNSGQSRLFKIFYIEKGYGSSWKSPRILSDEITTSFHDGPATFNKEGTIIYFSRNNTINNALKNIKDPDNKLGIYQAELMNGTWQNISPFKYNNSSWNFSTPSLSTDGKRLYFSSDMPGGNGGMDLYYCDRCDDNWCAPVNMGVSVNTRRNESFPFADRSGKVFFASDGHEGLGGKDLFFTLEENGGWIAPVHLDSAINSPADDFALVMDSTSQNGFFSSDRLHSDDIFTFRTAKVEFTSCDTVTENNYCFTFYDEHHPYNDTLPVIYRWDFGNGIIRTGAEVSHCFPGPGNYTVRLDIIDELTGDTINSNVEYKVQLDAIEQDYINTANIGITGRPILFSAGISNTEDMQITSYLWDFGKGFEAGMKVTEHIFEKQGIYNVRLGAKGNRDACTSKKIRIFKEYHELVSTSGIVSSDDFQSHVIMMDDLSQPEKSAIETVFNGVSFNAGFDPYGITLRSQLFLDKVAKALYSNPGLRLEIMVHIFGEENPGPEADQKARELGFNFKRNGIDPMNFSARAVDLNSLITKTEAEHPNSKGILEFIFMKSW